MTLPHSTASEWAAAGFALHAAGQYAEALDYYEKAVALDPSHAAVQTQRAATLVALDRPQAALLVLLDLQNHYPNSAALLTNIGQIYRLLGQWLEAARSFAQSLTLVGDDVKTLTALGQSLLVLHRPADAVDVFVQATTLDPQQAALWYALATCYRAVGSVSLAENAYGRAIALQPHYPLAHHHLGNTLGDQNRWPEATLSYLRAVSQQPDFVEAYNNLANSFMAQHKYETAIPLFEYCASLSPDTPEIYNNWAVALHRLDCLDEATKAYSEAIARKPDYAEAHNNLGNALQRQGHVEEAIEAYGRALTFKTDYAEVYNNRGAALLLLGRLDEAMTDFQRSLAMDERNADTHNNLANALVYGGFHQEAIARYREAVTRHQEPHHHNGHPQKVAGVRKNLALALLSVGNYAEGWAEYEHRWQSKELAPAYRAFAQPQWGGESNLDPAIKTVFLYAEQGLGDTLQFCRYVPLVLDRGWQVILEVPQPLLRLMSRLDPRLRVLEVGSPLPAFEAHCSLLSLPLALASRVDSIPPLPQTRWVRPEEVIHWQAHLSSLPPHRRRVGVVWAGSARTHAVELNAVDRRRSMPPAFFAPLANRDDISVVCLQLDSTPPFDCLNPMDKVSDFADTAALVAGLDLVITVDTSMVHLAGLLGKPVWLLNRCDSCWRWLPGLAGYEHTSPWYPSLRIFNQPNHGDWASVIEAVMLALDAGASPPCETP